jgi:hypothetical protein
MTMIKIELIKQGAQGGKIKATYLLVEVAVESIVGLGKR